MPNLDDHIDDLFRTAAENYGLKEGESQWDSIRTALSEKPVVANAVPTRRDLKTNRFLLLLLLLFFVASGAYLLHKDRSPVTHISIQAQVEYPRQGKTAETTQEQAGSNQPLSINKGSIIKTEGNLQTNIHAQVSGTSIHRVKQRKPWVAATGRDTYTERLPANEAVTERRHSELPGQAQFNTNNKINSNSNKIEYLVGEHPMKAINHSATTSSNLLSRAATLQRAHIDTSKQLLGIDSKQQRGVYLGFVAGPELNQVKSQGPRKLGMDVGLVAGYRFSRRIGIGSGFLFAKKFYYSTGKYFKMPGMDVLSLEGCSSVFEMPIKLQYSILNKPNFNIFSAVGISSYFITNEHNDYLLLINGAQQSMTSNYEKTSRHFAAAADLSIGYEKIIGKHTSLRIEHYLQIPLKGIGVGTMPVMSTGIHAGISRSFY